MDIELATNDPRCRLALKGLENQGDTAGFASWVEAASDGFAGRQLVGFHARHVADFVDALEEMDRTLRGRARLASAYEAHFIELEVGSTGGVTLTGELHDYRLPPQLLRFAFETDQTCLAPFARALRAAIAAPAI